jgi:hypothetical protein
MICAGVALSPAIATAGSPGMKCIRLNVSKLTSSRIGTALARRRRKMPATRA